LRNIRWILWEKEIFVLKISSRVHSDTTKGDFMARILLFMVLIVSVVVPGCSRKEQKKKSSYTIVRPTSAERVFLFGLDKNVLGFSDDLLFEIGKAEQVPLYPVSLDHSSLVTLLEAEDVDGVLSSLEPDEELRRRYLFSEPYFTYGPILIVAQDSPYSAIADMKNKEIGFEVAYFPALRLKQSSECIFRPFDNMNTVLEELLHKRLDGVIVDAIVAYKLILGPYRGRIRIVGEPLRPMSFRLIIKKGKSDELVSTFNHGLAAVKASGLFTKMLTYWGLFDIYNPEETLKPAAVGY